MIPSGDRESGWHEPSRLQPGARPPAPGDLALVQAFINSHYDLEFEHGADLFATPAALGQWLDRRGLLGSGATNITLTRADLRRAVAAREGLRALARANGDPGGPPPARANGDPGRPPPARANGDPGGPPPVRANGDPGRPAPADALAALNGAARGAAVEVRFSEFGPQFVPGLRGGLERALGAVLAIAAGAMIDGSWARLKVCPGEDCGWAFYDHSRNQSGRWCSMAVCGGRAKARHYYRRRRGGE